jgi:hypothetical protein
VNASGYQALNHRIYELLAHSSSCQKGAAPFENVFDIAANCCGVDRKSFGQYSTNSVMLPLELQQDIHDQQLTLVARAAPLGMVSAPTGRTLTSLFKGLRNPFSGHRGILPDQSIKPWHLRGSQFQTQWKVDAIVPIVSRSRVSLTGTAKYPSNAIVLYDNSRTFLMCHRLLSVKPNNCRAKSRQ